MDGYATGAPTHPRGAVARRVASPSSADGAAPASPPRRKIGGDLVLLALLLFAAAGLRAWLVCHSEVAARDSIGYIRQAWQLAHGPWASSLRNAQQHPGYPVALLAVSRAVRLVSDAPEPALMQFSAQLTNSLAGVLLVVPMYYLGRELFNRQVGFWAALLFQCLPASSRVLADGLSEGVFLLFAAAALLAAAVALRRHSVLASALTGLFGGCAYLTRPEGAFLVAATGLVLFALQGWAARRTSWRRLLACAGALTLAAVAVGGPLVAVTGALTVKATPRRVMEEMLGERHGVADAPRFALVPPQAAAPRALLAGRHSPRVVLADWWTEKESPQEWWAVEALAWELVKGTCYVAWVPMLLGLWWFRDRFRVAPGAWVMLLVSLTIGLCLWRVASRLGYVSSRHTLLILLCGSYWAAAAAPVIGRGLARGAFALAERFPRLFFLSGRCPAADSPAWSVLLPVALVAAMLPKAFEPLHANRLGFRHAGLWLAGHAEPWDKVIDPYCWSHYYAGKVFQEGHEVAAPAGAAATTYVVLEESGHEHSRLPLMKDAEALKKQGTAVFRWTGKRDKETVDVVVYAVAGSR